MSGRSVRRAEVLPGDQAALVEAAQSERDRLLLRVVLTTGARTSEVVALRRRDVRPEYVALPARNPADPPAAAERQLAQDLAAWAEQHALAEDDPLFSSRKRSADGSPRPLRRGQVWLILKQAAERAGVQPVAADRTAGDLRSGSTATRPAPTMTPLPALLIPAALVGRDVELAELEGRLEMARHGRGGMVLLTGEPGVGKTRLLRHAADRARVAGWLVLSGRAYDGSGWPPYFPLSDAFRGYVESCSIDQLQAQLGHAARDVALVVREVHTRLQPGPAPQRELAEVRSQLFGSLVDFLLAIARQHVATTNSGAGVVFVLDDLQWADPPTLAWFGYLAPRLSDAPVLVVGASRSVDLHRRHPVRQLAADLAHDRLIARLEVGPLSMSDTRRMLAQRIGCPPATEVAEALWRVTGGVPFFLDELTQQLLAERRDLTDPSVADQHWAVPDGAREVIARRVAELSDSGLRLLQTAAVLGDTLESAILALASGLDESTFLDALDELLAQGFIVEDGDKFHVTHALTRQAVYDGLSVPRRQQLHRRAAEAIRQVHARELEPHLAALATHYRLAGPAVDANQTIRAAVDAGASAAAAFAWENAANHWQYALRLMQQHRPEVEPRARLLERLGDLMLASRHDLRRGVRCLEEALGLWLGVGREADAARVHISLGRCHLALPVWGDQTNVARSLDHYRAALAILEQSEPGPLQGQAYLGLAHGANFQLDSETACRAAERAIEIAVKLGDVALGAEATMRYASALYRRGQIAVAHALYEQVLADAERADLANLCHSASMNAAQMLLLLGDPADSLRWCERELQLRRARRPAALTGVLHWWLAHGLVASGQLARARGVLGATADNQPSIAYAEGEWDRAQTLNDETIARFSEAGDRKGEAEARELAARIACARLAWDAAERELSAVLALLDRRGILLWEGPVCARMAVTLARMGRSYAARSYADRCHRILTNGENWRGQTGLLHLAQAVVCGVEGRITEAEVRFGEALQTFQRFGLPWLEAETLEHWAYMLNLHGRTVSAGPIAQAAATVYQGIGAGAPWIKRVARAVQPIVVPGPGPAQGLTPRQADVLRRLADGKTNSEIAQELAFSTRTVERHIETIYARIGANGSTARAQAAAYAYRHGLVGPPADS